MNCYEKNATEVLYTMKKCVRRRRMPKFWARIPKKEMLERERRPKLGS